MSNSVAAPLAPQPLIDRYRPEHLGVFTDTERGRFLAPFGDDARAAMDGDEGAWQRIAPALGWELLYRIEPQLYERLIAGEKIHEGVHEWLPSHIGRAVEVAAGAGRFTLDLAPRTETLVAVEPAYALRMLLQHKIERRGWTNVDIREGFFDAIPVPDDWAELVISCSSFTPDPAHGGERGLAELERVAAPGGFVVMVWPSDVPWLEAHGFMHITFEGELAVEFASPEEAVEIARIFYPDAADEIASRRITRVPYELLGMNPPRDLAWKRVE